MVKIKNTGDESLAFAGVPMIPAGDTVEVSDDIAEAVKNHPSIKIVKDSVKGTEPKTKDSFQAVE